MTKDEALKLALEALESLYNDSELMVTHRQHKGMKNAITAIRAALAESEARRKEFSETTKRNMEHVEWYLSTHAPEPVAYVKVLPMGHNQENRHFADGLEHLPPGTPLYVTPPQPEQEPVALYVYKPTLPRGNLGNVSDGDLPWVYDQDPSSGYSARMLVYTTPPQRKPLSNQKIIEMYNEPRSDAEMIEFARAIEAAHGIWPENSDCYGPDWTDRDGEYLK